MSPPWPGNIDSIVREQLLVCTKYTPEQWSTAKGRVAGMFAGKSEAVAKQAGGALATFKPSPAHIPWMLSPCKRILVRAGGRVGKSEHAAAKMVALALTHPGGRYRAVGVMFRQVARVIGKLLYQLIPKSALTRDSRYSPTRGWSNQLIRFINGAEIELRSYDQEQAAFAGNALDGVWLDEPPPEDLFFENEARLLDRNGFMLVTCTPAGYPLKWFREIVEAEDTAWEQYTIKFDHFSCPWYSKQQIKDWIDHWRKIPGQYGQRINGDWEGITVGRFFAGFNHEKHVKDWDRGISSPTLKWRLGLDHGQGENREVGTLCAIRADNGACKSVHVAREFRSGAGLMGAREIAAAIKAMIVDVCENAGIVLDVFLGRLEIIGDSNSSGLGKATRYNEEIALELKRLGIYNDIESPQKKPGDREDGEAMINSLAIRDGLTVDPTCILTLDGLNHYVQGKEAHKDAIDALRYGIFDLITSRPHGPKLYRG